MNQSVNKPVLAVDIGGTKILLALISRAGEMLARQRIPTLDEHGYEKVIRRLNEAIREFLDDQGIDEAGICGIGIACAGGIDTKRGVVVTPSPNLPDWHDIPLAKMVRREFDVPVQVVNDASAAALGEHHYGAGRGVDDLVLLTLGTGIGGGIIIDGKLYLGASGAAAEIGHMTVADGPPCGCGNVGCLERLASGTAVEEDTIMRLERGDVSLLLEMTCGNIREVTAKMVGEAARLGDGLAQDVLARAAYYLGVGCVNLVNIFNPEMIIFGGGMSALGDFLLQPVRRLVDERAFGISSRAVKIVIAELGNEAGVYGAAGYVMGS